MANKPMHRQTREPLPLRQARRCGARTRSGNPCLSPVVKARKGAECTAGRKVAPRRQGDGTGITHTAASQTTPSKTKGTSWLDEGYEIPMGLSRARRRGVIEMAAP